eukprot:scaffold168768_cov37-Tisochrysis_lutea.AAC.2
MQALPSAAIGQRYVAEISAERGIAIVRSRHGQVHIVSRSSLVTRGLSSPLRLQFHGSPDWEEMCGLQECVQKPGCNAAPSRNACNAAPHSNAAERFVVVIEHGLKMLTPTRALCSHDGLLLPKWVSKTLGRDLGARSYGI